MATKKKRFSWIKWPVLAVAVLTSGWLGSSMFSVRGEVDLPPLQTASAERGNIQQTIVTTGQLNPVLNVQVGSQVSGILKEILVDFNSPVTEGQVLARIDPAMFQASANLARAEVESAEAALELAQVNARRTQQLRERGLVSESDVDEAVANLRQAEATLKIRTHTLERAELELARCTIYSPTSGIVISRDIDVGQTVAASLSAPTLFLIANDLSRMQINANVSEADIGGIQPGQHVDFRVDAYPGETFEGNVIQIRNAPIVVDNVVTYDTVIEVDNPELKLKPGMTAEVSIVTAETNDVIRVPNGALRTRLPEQILPLSPPEIARPEGSNVRTVYRLTSGDSAGGIEAGFVRTGISDGVHTEILEGLQEGEVLVTGVDLQRQQRQRNGTSSLFGGNQAQY